MPAPRYAAALSVHPVAFEAVGAVAGELIEQLEGERPDLVVAFVSPHHLDEFGDITAGLRRIVEPDVLIGLSAGSIAGGGREIEEQPALSAWAANWGGGRATGFILDVESAPDGVRVDGWPTNVTPDSTVLLLAEPFTFPVADLLALCNERLPGLRVIGGLASAGTRPGVNRLASDDRELRSGAVGVVLAPDVEVQTIVSQGCRPVGDPFTVTRAERNVVFELGGRRALTRLEELVTAADEHERALLARGLHVGIVVDEHRLDFGRGDFLVRNVLGGDRESGALTVGEEVDVGQTLQFHVRDADAADEDLAALLGETPRAVAGALLFTCNGRGTHLFGLPDHDAGLIEAHLGPVPLAGASCAGEIGPVGGKNFLHGFTASIALFGASSRA